MANVLQVTLASKVDHVTDMLAKLVAALVPPNPVNNIVSLVGRGHNHQVRGNPSAGDAEGLDTSRRAVLNSSRG